ncbi:MAG: cytidylate kinase family protein [Candidatus Parvarchaeota archaeon]|nr:cytidylate kinase family protein [Candidatus Jingweiarchaeum tengchongense]MCW1298035.1 cytidylate kinase family protein [Candidatus Jingweiarchaeum tengchongense]MCW1300165.1 cytidylate kinase family protein [Candidatus Jingweiarchaeum tengchongense]MCW1304375.1 cytidylate kinase family protein [Candidatus Jingweiarchaeum tengchongense]MCW1305905.1 cytidylate kinase family protein [Candidatus Jingweiarchaeum tengchongense]
MLKKFENRNLKKEGITITISGLSGSGKSTVAKEIAKATGLKYFSGGAIFRREAKTRGIKLVELCKIREKELDLLVDKKILELAQRGNVVIDSRLAGLVAGDFADIRIFVLCSLEKRARRVARRDKKKYEETLRLIKERDEADLKMYKKIYKVNMLDLNYYNFVIDNTLINLSDLKKLSRFIGKALLKEFK